jgi:hypothetical protein
MEKCEPMQNLVGGFHSGDHVNPHHIKVSSWLLQRRQLYFVTQLALVVLLDILPSDLSELSDSVVFFIILKMRIF